MHRGRGGRRTSQDLKTGYLVGATPYYQQLGLVIGVIEGWSIQESIYFAFVSGLTIGYGDRVPVTTEGRLVAVALMISGVLLFGAVTASFATWLNAPNVALQVSRGGDSAVTSESASASNINLICFVCSDADFTKDSQTLAVTLTTTANGPGASNGHGGTTTFAARARRTIHRAP